MALPNTAGYPVLAILDGQPYAIFGDCNAQADLSGEEIEALATSGGSVYKHSAKPKSIKGIDVKMSVQDFNLACQIKAAAKVSLPQGLKYSDGTMVTGPGRCKFGEHNSNENKMTAEIYFDDVVVAAG